MKIFDDFNDQFSKHWTQVTTGGGKLSMSGSILRMEYDFAKSDHYTDAQIDDYTMLSKKDYLWKPPLRMTVRARTSHPAATEKDTEKNKDVLHGTAGFGFWNKPFTMQGNWFTMPESVWFFYSSPESNMALNPGVPGWGWKAQVIHGSRLSVIPQVIPLAATVAYGKLSGNTKPASAWLQRFSGTRETLISEDITEWHTYRLDWLPKEVIFYVNDKEILRTPFSPTRPLGFVAWLDNAFAIATPKGEIKFGRTDCGPQWLDMDSVKIEQI